MLAQNHALGTRMLQVNVLQHQSQLKTGPEPGRVDDGAAVDFAGQAVGVFRGRHRNRGIRMRVVHLAARDKRVQGRVNGRRTRVQVKRAVGVHAHHFVFGFGFRPALFGPCVNALKLQQLVLIQRRKVLPLCRPQVAAGAFDPENFDVFAAERVGFGNLRRRVPAAGVGDAPVRAQEIRAVNKASDGIKRVGFFVFPVVRDKAVGSVVGHGCVSKKRVSKS